MNSPVQHEDAVRRQVEHILSSSAFRSSTSLRRLLEYLTEQTLDGGAQDLKEYRIGVEALGKAEVYDPRVDPSVRVQVGRLRSRLAEYYQTEGAQDPIVISVPKGGFGVVFEERRTAVEAPVAEPLEPPPPAAPAMPPPARIRPVAWIALGLLGVAIILSLFYSPMQDRKTDGGAAFQELWKPYLASEHPILISMGIPMWIHFESKGPDGTVLAGDVRDGRLNEWPVEAAAEEGKLLESWRKLLKPDKLEPRHHYMAVGEAMATATLSKALGRYANPTLVRSNLLSWDNVHGSNTIFVGAPKFSPHMRHAPFIQNFRIGNFQVDNLHPEPGELPAYPNEPKSTDRRGAALVGRYRNPWGGWLTIIGSANSMCTWAAVEYLTRPDYVAKLTGAIKRKYGRIPDSFEIVIEASFDQASPIEIHHTAIRSLEK